MVALWKIILSMSLITPCYQKTRGVNLYHGMELLQTSRLCPGKLWNMECLSKAVRLKYISLLWNFPNTQIPKHLSRGSSARQIQLVSWHYSHLSIYFSYLSWITSSPKVTLINFCQTKNIMLLKVFLKYQWFVWNLLKELGWLCEFVEILLTS